jgi:fatty acid desaturase
MINLRSLKDELRAEGLFERCELRTWGKFSFFALCIAGFLYAHTILPLWGSALLVPVTAWFCACLAMMGHEGSHRAFSTDAFRNQVLFHLAFPVMGGVSAKYWHSKHDVQHHAYPNVVDTDPDILLWPMASTALEYRRSSKARQWFQRNFQGTAFWPLCFLLVWSMRGSGIAFLYRYARDKGMDKSWWADAGSLAVHALVWIVLPMTFFGLWGLALYASIWTLVGIALSMVFAPAHIGMPIVSDPDDIIRLQFETTRNLVLPFGLSFFFIGLEHQIEHHLFPRIPHQNLARAAEITKAWAERNDVAYHQIGYLDGLKDTSRFMGTSWQYEPGEFAQIQPQQPAPIETALSA